LICRSGFDAGAGREVPTGERTCKVAARGHYPRKQSEGYVLSDFAA